MVPARFDEIVRPNASFVTYSRAEKEALFKEAEALYASVETDKKYTRGTMLSAMARAAHSSAPQCIFSSLARMTRATVTAHGVSASESSVEEAITAFVNAQDDLLLAMLQQHFQNVGQYEYFSAAFASVNRKRGRRTHRGNGKTTGMIR